MDETRCVWGAPRCRSAEYELIPSHRHANHKSRKIPDIDKFASIYDGFIANCKFSRFVAKGEALRIFIS